MSLFGVPHVKYAPPASSLVSQSGLVALPLGTQSHLASSSTVELMIRYFNYVFPSSSPLLGCGFLQGKDYAITIFEISSNQHA